MQVKFKFEKETKNTIRFQEIDEGEGCIIGALYIQKDAIDDIGWKNESDTIVVDIHTE